MADLPNVDETTTTTPPVGTNPEDSKPSEDVSPDGRMEVEGEDETDEEADRSARYRKLSSDKKRLALENAELKKRLELAEAMRLAQARQDEMRTRNVPTPYNETEVDTAFRTLKDKGMMTRDEAEAMFGELKTRVEWDFKHRDNERDINRKSSNLPHYDRDEVESYARQHNISDPLLAYRDMYFDEITDAVKKTAPKSTPTTTMKPSKPTDAAKEGLTLETFRQNMSGPNAKEYYEKLTRENPQKLDEIMKSLSEG